jgi:hypothetical protein
VDAVGIGLDEVAAEQVDEITAAHPRGDFKREFLQTTYAGLKNRPDTTYGTINADVLERFMPHFRRGSMVDRIVDSHWAT